MVRDATAELGDEVGLNEVYAHDKADMRARGESIDMVYVDGEAFRPDGPPATQAEFHQVLRERFARKNKI